MSSTSVFLNATPALAVPVAATTDAPGTSPETPTENQASFARIMSDASTDASLDTSSNQTHATEGKDEKDAKHRNNKTPVQQVTAQVVAALVTPPVPPPALAVPAGKLSAGDVAVGDAPVNAVPTQENLLLMGDVPGGAVVSDGKAAGSSAKNLINAKQPSDHLSADDLKASSVPTTGSTKEAPTSVADGQLPITTPLTSTDGPAVVENAVQPALAAATGTAIAKQVGRVKMQEKTENNSEVAEKNLPPTSFVAQTGASSDAAKPRAIVPNLSQHEGRNSSTADTSAPVLTALGQGKAQTLGNNTSIDIVRSPQTDKVFTEISERVMSFKRMGTDSAEVNLRPDNNTEITLSLSLRNGQVEMTARLERGNVAALNSHWTGLQQSLSQQGVRVGQLTSSQSAMNDQFSSGARQQGSGESSSQSFERGTENFDDLAVASPMVGLSNGRPPKAVAATGRGWEMWA